MRPRYGLEGNARFGHLNFKGGMNRMHPVVEQFHKRRSEKFDHEILKRESREKNRTSPRNPIASNINRDCVREMVLAMRHPVEKIVRDHDRLARFEDARVAANACRRELEDLGFEVTDVETTIPPIKGRKGEVMLTGVIDFQVNLGGKRYPTEVKAPHPLIFQKLDKLEDFERHWWTKKWVDQLIAYLFAKGLEEGFILLTALGDKKWIHVSLDDPAILERAESALQVVEEAATSYNAGETPDFAKDPNVCRGCWAFGVVCHPPIEEKAAARIDDEEFYAMALRALELKPLRSEYEALWKKISSTVKATEQERVTCRDLGFKVKEIHRKGYEVKPTTYREVEMFQVGQAAKGEVA